MKKNSDPREETYTSLLTLDFQLQQRWTKAPHVYVSRARNHPDQKFYMIWVCIGKDSFSLSELWFILKRTVCIGLENRMFADMLGAEIVPSLSYTNRNEVPRILRLSFFSKSINALLAMKPQSLLEGDIVPDEIRCTWYLPPPTQENIKET